MATRLSGEIQLIIGPMFCGKTTELFRRVQRHSLALRRCTLIKSAKDQRYSDASHVAVTHDRQCMQAVPVMRLDEAEHLADTTDVFGIDEGQFFPDIVPFCERMANRGKLVIVAALDGTYQRQPFGSIIELIPRAETVTKLAAVCRSCGADAAFSHRLTNEKAVELVAGADKYAALCRACWNRAQSHTPL
jgi:thymidine kinase